MIIVTLVLHNLSAMFLLGALMHQAASCWRPMMSMKEKQPSMARSFMSVRGRLYANTVVTTYVITVVLGDVLYGPYRVDVKTMLFDLELWSWNGIFEIKEHLVALGLFLLAPYWRLWGAKDLSYFAGPRRAVTTLLAAIVAFALIAGHLLNNLKGVGF